jgi:hypothetical protein
MKLTTLYSIMFLQIVICNNMSKERNVEVEAILLLILLLLLSSHPTWSIGHP